MKELSDGWRKIAARVPGMVYHFEQRPDGSSCFPYASEAIREIYRVSPEEVREDAAKVFAVIHPDDLDEIVASIQESARTLEPWQLEYRVRFDDGTVRWLFGNSVPEREPDGTVLWHGFITDITERKRTEDAIKNIVIGVSTRSDKSFFDSMTLHMAKALGADFALIGKINVEEHSVVTTSFCIADQVIDNIEYMLAGTPCENVLRDDLCSYQDNVWQAFPEDAMLAEMGIQGYVGVPLYDSKQEVIGLMAAMYRQPISNIEFAESVLQIFASQTALEIERSQAEGELRKLSTAVEQSASTIYITDTEGTIVFVNPAFFRSTGYTLEEAMGQNPRILKSGHHSDEFYRDMWQTLVRGDVWQGEMINKKKNGDLYWETATISPIKSPDGRIIQYMAVREDITERKRGEEELRAAKKQAESASRFKSEFLANMSHEIRTPMNAVIGFTELLDELITDGIQRTYLDSIKNGGRNLLVLINDILDLSKIEAGKMEIQVEPTEINSLFKEIEQVFGPRMTKKNLDFRIEIEPGLPRLLFLDERRLRQVLLNIVGNAVKFTDAGHIKLSARSFQDQAGLVLIIAIEDTGIGIPEEEHQKIFKAFLQQEGQDTPKYGGTGLGLTISKRLVETMNGAISVRSKAGQGSIFEITLEDVRVSSDHPEPRVEPDLEPYKMVLDTATIMLVDDTDVNLRLLMAMLEPQRNLRILVATNGQDAIALAREHKPDLVFMDLKMPKMDGYQATRQIKEDPELKSVRVVALTASATKEARDKVKAAKFDGYLSKPINLIELYQEMARFISYYQKADAPEEYDSSIPN